MPAFSLRVFDDLISRHDLDARPERGGDAAILGLGQLDGRGHGRLRDSTAAYDVAHLDAREGAWMFVTPLAPHLDAVDGNLLPLLLQDRDHVHGRAAAERDEQQLHRRRRAPALMVCLQHLRMPARRDPDEETVARGVDDSLRPSVVHEPSTLPFRVRITRRSRLRDPRSQALYATRTWATGSVQTGRRSSGFSAPA